MPNLPLTLACGDYDSTQALREGLVRPEGIDLIYVPIQSPPEIFARMVKKHSFDVCEMSTSHYITMRAKGGFPFLALPIFPSRFFRHGNIFVNEESGIETPKDLEGKRIGVQEYRQTAAIWIRGILQSEYGVDLDGVRWYEGGVDRPRPPDADMDLRPNKPVSITLIGETSLGDMLARGEIDALIGARTPACYGKAPNMRRLFADFRAVERDYFHKTGIFPMMHTLMVRQEVYDANPWIAESLFKAWEASKAIAKEKTRFSGTLRHMLPWLFADLDEIDQVFGGDPWPNGLEPNRKALEILVGYLVDQGFVERPVPLEELFAPVITWTE
jgi:4,5-dihydroxyphthalate decarboxylase